MCCHHDSPLTLPLQSEHQTLPVAVVWLRPGPAHATPAATAAPAMPAAPKPPLSAALAAASVSSESDAAAAKAVAIIKDAEAKAAVIIKAAESAAAQTKAKVEIEAKAAADAQAKINAEEKAAAAAKKTAVDKAAAEATKADNAAAEPVHIGGATGSSASNVNGIYDPTEELSSGRRVYKKRNHDIWIELFEGKWQVKPASGKGKDNCWAFFAAGRALEACGDSTWQVYDGKAWAVQASVKLMPESRAFAVASAAGASAFATFSRAYASSEAPRYLDELMSSVRVFILAACRKYGASQEAGHAFFEALQAGVFKARVDCKIHEAASLLWNSQQRLQLGNGGIEFCCLLNRALMQCDLDLLPTYSLVVRGINSLFIPPSERFYPPDGMAHRGSTLPRVHLPFFTAGKKFRVPMILSADVKEDTAYG
jgi:hypothetical protein